MIPNRRPMSRAKSFNQPFEMLTFLFLRIGYRFSRSVEQLTIFMVRFRTMGKNYTPLQPLAIKQAYSLYFFSFPSLSPICLSTSHFQPWTPTKSTPTTNLPPIHHLARHSCRNSTHPVYNRQLQPSCCLHQSVRPSPELVSVHLLLRIRCPARRRAMSNTPLPHATHRFGG
jgi:hypothetical protein